MKRVLLGLIGISLASLIRGLRFGWTEFRRASGMTTWNIKPFELRAVRQIPEREIEEILGVKGIDATIRVQRFESGMLPQHEAAALTAIVAQADPAVVLEIGTFMGHTTYLMARNLPRAIIHTLDLPLDYSASADQITQAVKDDSHLIESRAPGREFIHTPEAARVRQHFGDSAVWDFNRAAGATLFFIDGSHTYSYVRNDSEKCLALCGGNGIFLWHDCGDGHPGVVKFLLEWRAQGRDVVRVAGTTLAYLKLGSVKSSG
jgi:hypothetical protein